MLVKLQRKTGFQALYRGAGDGVWIGGDSYGGYEGTL